MSYTKMNIEIERYLKANNLPWSGKSTDTKEETNKRLIAYKYGRDVILKKWIEEKKYKELISCVHGGWFTKEEFLIPVAKHFVKKKELSCLKFLYEKRIRYSIEGVLSTLTYAQEDYPDFTIDDFLSQKIENFLSKTYSSIVELLKWRNNTLSELDTYLEFLKQIGCEYNYLQMIEEVRSMTNTLQIKKKDFKHLKNKLL